MQIYLDTNRIEDYRTFLAVKSLPTYHIQGRTATFPDEYASRLGLSVLTHDATNYTAPDWMFDYQAAVAELAIRKRKFAAFARCGLGKTAIMSEFAGEAIRNLKRVNKGFLIVSPLNVIEQTSEEIGKFYGGGYDHDIVPARDLQKWLDGCSGRIGITNYESLKASVTPGQLGGMALDESSSLKDFASAWAGRIIKLGKGLDWKLCCTGTPAPNDRIEFANHAVFLDHFTSVNSFLATYFINRGQTSARWELKPHALGPFYRALSHWCIFLSDPSVYGWKDNCDTIPPIHTHMHEVGMTDEQVRIMRETTGQMFATAAGGITKRSKFGQLAKGRHNGKDVPTLKYDYIRDLVDGWRDEESTIIWCIYNDEQEQCEKMFPNAASISGTTPYDERMKLIREFKSGKRRELISKAKVLGYGLNLQCATRHVFSGLQDSAEMFIQCISRSNRVGSTKPLNVHIPVTELEETMVQNVFRKLERIDEDTREQERIFREYAGELGI